MSANAAPTPVPAAPAAAPSADDVLSDLAARRLTLAADVDELAARLAPNNLVKNRLVSLAGGGTDPEGGVDTYDPSTLTLGQRVSRLFDDARDGDPASLGIVTVAGLALAGLSVTATVAAVKALRARAGRA